MIRKRIKNRKMIIPKGKGHIDIVGRFHKICNEGWYRRS